jgi:hypothetical protein
MIFLSLFFGFLFAGLERSRLFVGPQQAADAKASDGRCRDCHYDNM